MDLTELNDLLADPANTTFAAAQKWAPGLLQNPDWVHNAPVEVVLSAVGRCVFGRKILTPDQAMSASMSLRFRPRLQADEAEKIAWASDLIFRRYGSSN